MAGLLTLERDSLLGWQSPPIPALPGSGEQLLLPDYSGELRAVVPDTQESVRMYVCGITPYDATHLGHAATYLVFDVLNRTLRDAGKTVTFVENVTDVDDPLFDRASSTGRSWSDIAAEQTDLFTQDMTALRVIPPEEFIRTSDHISQTAALVERLEQKGATYRLNDKIYLDVSGVELFPSVAEMPMAERLALLAERGGDPATPGKVDPADPIIWHLTETEPSWQTSVGIGRPGWHVECVSIAEDSLGLPFDIQGGGADLLFPHHQMCDATVRCLEGGPLAKSYMHVGLVWLDGKKMSKSLGNLIFVSHLLAEGIPSEILRLSLIDRDWREDMEWNDSRLEHAKARHAIWRNAGAMNDRQKVDSDDSAQTNATHLQAVRRCLASGLDLPAALAAMDSWAQSPQVDGELFARASDALLGLKL